MVPELTREQATEILSERDWAATPLMGFAWIVGPVLDGMVEAYGQGPTLEAAVRNALESEGVR